MGTQGKEGRPSRRAPSAAHAEDAEATSCREPGRRPQATEASAVAGVRVGLEEPERQAVREDLRLEGEGHDPVSAIVLEPESPRAFMVLAHGAGAPMTHPFMERLANDLSDHGVSTLRFNFAYMEAGRRRPDRPPRLLAVVGTALEAGCARARSLPLFAGGKSMGGRMTSTFLSGHGVVRRSDHDTLTQSIRGVVFYGFPLHRPGVPSQDRGVHLADVQQPMIFLQGTRDTLADLDHLRPVTDGLGPRATLHVVEGADHGFHVLKRSGRTPEDVREEIAATTWRWMAQVLGEGR